MNTVPKMISTKDLAYISDIFEWNYVMSKKINMYSKQVSNQRVSELLLEIAKMHSDHCHILLNILGGNYE